MIQKKAPLQPYNTKQLALLYNIDPRTLNGWIEEYQEEIGPRIGYLYNVLQVEILFVAKGWPMVTVQK